MRRRSARVADGRRLAVGRARLGRGGQRPAADLGVGHAGHHHQVVAGDQGERRQEGLGHGLLGQLGEHDQHGPAPEPGQGLGEGAPVVALGQQRLELVHGLGDPRELVAGVPGGDHGPDLAVEGDQPGPVAEAGGQRGQHHHGVHGVVEAGHVGDPAGHRPAAVQQQQHRLVPLGPVGAHDRLAGPGGGRPVDPAELVVDAVLAHRVELGPAAAALGRPEPDLQDAGLVHPQLGLVRASRTAGTPAAPRAAAAAPAWPPAPAAPRPAAPPRSGVNRPRRPGRSVVAATALPLAGTTTRARLVAAPSDGASSSASRTRTPRPPRLHGPAAVGDPPHDPGLGPEGHDPRQLPLDLQRTRPDRQQPVHDGRHQQRPVHHPQPGRRRDRQHQHHQRPHRRRHHQPPGRHRPSPPPARAPGTGVRRRPHPASGVTGGPGRRRGCRRGRRRR